MNFIVDSRKAPERRNFKMAKKEMTYAQAICNALDQEMARDKNIVQLGEDIGFIGGNF